MLLGISFSQESHLDLFSRLNFYFNYLYLGLSIFVSIAIVFLIFLWPYFILKFKKVMKVFFGPFTSSVILHDNGHVTAGKITAKCPIQVCSGQLTVKTAWENEQGVKIAGICNKLPALHVFEFDSATMRGRPANLTPKRKQPASESKTLFG